jgi:hypothetical protein
MTFIITQKFIKRVIPAGIAGIQMPRMAKPKEIVNLIEGLRAI